MDHPAKRDWLQFWDIFSIFNAQSLTIYCSKMAKFPWGNETKWGPMGLPGMEAFLSPISCRQDSSFHDFPWVPKGRYKQLKIKGGAARKPPEARLKWPEKLIKIRRLPTWDPAQALILSATPPFWNSAEERRMQDCYCLDPYRIPLTTSPDYRTSPYSPGRGTQFLRC